MEEKYLTSRQKELIAIAKGKGFLTLNDFQKLFSSPVSLKANIDKLVALGILKAGEVIGRFEYSNDDD